MPQADITSTELTGISIEIISVFAGALSHWVKLYKDYFFVSG